MKSEADRLWEEAKAVARRYREQESEINRRAQKQKRKLPPELSGETKRLLLMVCDTYELRMVSLLGRRKTKTVVEARQLAMWLARRLLNLSYPEVGALMDRDHSTVMSGERAAANRMQRDPRYLERAETIERRWAQPVAAE